MSYLNSNRVRVFPTTQREKFDPAAKFTTEYNLASLINKLLDTKAFVLSDNVSTNNNILNKLEFNIMGYYFFIENVDLSNLTDYATTSNTFLNATIKITEAQYNAAESTDVGGNEVTSSLNNWWKLEGDDNNDDNSYSGISFSWQNSSTFETGEQSNQKDDNINESESTDGKYIVYTFTILKRNSSGGYEIPQESKIRFKTSKSGSKHSLMIDDGEL